MIIQLKVDDETLSYGIGYTTGQSDERLCQFGFEEGLSYGTDILTLQNSFYAAVFLMRKK